MAVVVPDDGLDVHRGTTMAEEVVRTGLGVRDVARTVVVGNEPSSLDYGGGFEGGHCDLLGWTCSYATVSSRVIAEKLAIIDRQGM